MTLATLPAHRLAFRDSQWRLERRRGRPLPPEVVALAIEQCLPKLIDDARSADPLQRGRRLDAVEWLRLYAVVLKCETQAAGEGLTTAEFHDAMRQSGDPQYLAFQELSRRFSFTQTVRRI